MMSSSVHARAIQRPGISTVDLVCLDCALLATLSRTNSTILSVFSLQGILGRRGYDQAEAALGSHVVWCNFVVSYKEPSALHVVLPLPPFIIPKTQWGILGWETTTGLWPPYVFHGWIGILNPGLRSPILYQLPTPTLCSSVIIKL